MKITQICKGCCTVAVRLHDEYGDIFRDTELKAC